MISQIVSASFGYADIAFLAILLLGLILGLIRGVAKSFKGLFLTVAIILSALLLVGLTMPKAREIAVFDQLDATIVEKSAGWGEAFSSPLYKNEDGSFYVEVAGEGGETEKVPLSNVGGFKGKIANFLAERFVTDEGQSLGKVAADYITNIVVAVACFVVFCIALSIVAWLIRKLFEKMHDTENKALKAIDRILGALVSAALTLLFLLVVLAVFHIFDDKLAIVTDYLKESTICGYLYENNPISTVFSKIFG